MAQKRKRVVLSIEQKLEAIRRVEDGEIMRSVADDLNVGTSTVTDWVKSKEKLLAFSEKPGRCAQGKVMKTGTYATLNENLFLWFTEQVTKGISITGPILKEKAKLLASQLGEEMHGFCASDGWLNKWKYRYGVRLLAGSSDKLTAETQNLLEIISECKALTEEYCDDQIFRTEITILDYKSLPCRSDSNIENVSPANNEKMTLLFCYNASGDSRLPILVISSPKESKVLNHFNPNAFPVYYRSQKDGQITPNMFEEWFQNYFVPYVRKFLQGKNLPDKAVLLVDNTPLHSDSIRQGNVITRLYPINDENRGRVVTESFKVNYRRSFLRFVLPSEFERIATNARNVSIKDAIYWVANAWIKLRPEIIAASWNKILDKPNTPSYLENYYDDLRDLKDLVSLIEGCENMLEDEVEDWIKNDESTEVFIDKNDESIKEEEDDSWDEQERLVSPDEAFQALITTLRFVEQHSTSTPQDVLLLRHWLDTAVHDRRTIK